MSSKHEKVKVGDKSMHGKTGLLVEVRHNDIEKAIRTLKRKINQEGVLKDLRKKEFYVRPGEIKRRKQAEAVNRWRLKERLLRQENIL
jgi:small subunit ribosomal protein S21